jgi:hypothetical protein
MEAAAGLLEPMATLFHREALRFSSEQVVRMKDSCSRMPKHSAGVGAGPHESAVDKSQF